MSEEGIRVCFLSQDLAFTDPLKRALGPGFSLFGSNAFDARSVAALCDRCDAVLLDLRSESSESSNQSNLGLIDEIMSNPAPPAVVAFCNEGHHHVILQAIERGACDTITNPPNMMELRLILRRAYRFQSAAQEVTRLKAATHGSEKLPELIGSSSAMQDLFALVRKVGPCDVTVMISGETGTGKEVLARAIHQLSNRSARPLVAFSCVNLPETLVEDELFGHEKGAFTGALTLRRGRFEAADRSTLFLDEIGDLGPGLQPKLLRVLQERNFQRLGGSSTVEVNIRVICATNRNLSQLVEEGKFREDLFYRLNVVQMHLPPLRERRDDIPLLAQHFLEIFARQFRKKTERFSRNAIQALEDYAWPGNVRELQNVIQRAVVLAEGPTVSLRQLPPTMHGTCETQDSDRLYEREVRDFKRRLILRTLRECGWQKVQTAKKLGVARAYLHRLINQLDIQPAEEEASPRSPETPLPPATRIM